MKLKLASYADVGGLAAAALHWALLLVQSKAQLVQAQCRLSLVVLMQMPSP